MPYHTGNEMLDPYIIFDKAQLRAGMHVADFGCGKTGHLVFPASALLGEHGIIYAVDVLKEVLDLITKRIKSNHVFLNIKTVWSDLEKIGATAIPEGSLDVIFLVNILVQTNDRMSVLEEARRLLKDKSRLIIVDWTKKGLRFGPANSRFVDFESIKNWARENGLAVQEEFEVGRYHRGLVLYKH